MALLALGQSLDCHNASEVSLKDMGKSVNVQPQQSTAKQKPCAYFLGYTVYRPHDIISNAKPYGLTNYFKIQLLHMIYRLHISHVDFATYPFHIHILLLSQITY